MSSFWRSIAHFEKSKILRWIALRNSLAVALPLAAGVAAGRPAAGLIAAIGALNVAYSDSTDPYFYRARRMLAASVLVSLAVFAGGLSGGHVVFSVLLAAVCAFAAGMMVAVSQTAADIGNITLVTLIVFSAHAMSPVEAWDSGGLALAGGILQTAFALALWPLRGRTPERRALANLYAEMARSASAPAHATEAPPASQESTQAQKELAVLEGSPSLEAERYLALLSQAERIRLALLALARLRIRMGREGGPQAPLDRCLAITSHVLASVAQALFANQPAASSIALLEEVRALAESFRQEARQAPGAGLQSLLRDACRQVEALAGQLRSAVELAARISPAGAATFAKRESAQPWSMRFTGARAKLRANLTLESAALRHAIRLGACVALGEAVAHAVDWQRSYWIPMTISIVLRPDFTGTFSRGVLRLAGTLFGLALATLLFHALTPSIGIQVALIFLLTFLMRSLGPANYGVFVTALSALIVLLIAMTGVAPAQVIAARGANTFAGGVIALLAYALWPTWERRLIGEALAHLLDAYRRYFDAVRDSYLEPGDSGQAARDRARLEARLARSNLEASATRVRAEPGMTAQRLATLDGMLANSHRFIHGVMAIEAGLARSQPVPARPAFRKFTADVDRTLELLAAALRGAVLDAGRLPDLREDHHELVHTGDARIDRYELVNIETDRITNSLNTLAGEIQVWIIT
jgi:uncharacterized membrane protein YccC